ncbi:conserved hypothetical protein [Sulfolobus islandicus L.S.2.15]|uniref:Uncharacterized protein n=1 Tax=Saccharolobus islandicus (strain L.S.2.15 / Lassen \|nr:hypothetical protein [Sulfolobus islandicus]ACP36410.1 conserved hypothetical protein [Sulfolobus islandicus L.S.2.15]
MELKDECGCIVNRKYASDFLMKRLFSYKKKINAKKLGYFRIDNSRWFTLYRAQDGKIHYESSECPLLIITLEALCERYIENEGKINRDNSMEKLRQIKGFTTNQIVNEVVEKFINGVSNG